MSNDQRGGGHAGRRDRGHANGEDESGPPKYHGALEPLDLTKVKLDGDQGSDDSGSSDEMESEEQDLADEDERFTRGRSRSRSMHSNDEDGASVLPEGMVDPNSPPPFPQRAGEENKTAPAVERKGPLPHREVVALQKGLEEATQSMSKAHCREDEEERMAADAEKRKRLLAANHQASSSNEPVKRFKLLLLGDSAVGKSSLILRWTMDSFSPNLTSTVGVNFKSKKVQCYGEWLSVQVWDTSGQENFHKITTSYYRGAQGIMLVYDVAEPKSLANVAYWIKNIKAHASESVQVVLVGNKIDLRGTNPDCVTTDQGREVAGRFHVPFFETSAKAANHVDEAFMTLVAEIAQQQYPPSATNSVAVSPLRTTPTSHLSPVNAAATANTHTPPSSGATTTSTAADNSNGKSSGGSGNGTVKDKILGALTRRRSSGGSTLTAHSSPNSTNTSTVGAGPAGAGAPSAEHAGVGSPEAAEGEDKEKCIIS